MNNFKISFHVKIDILLLKKNKNKFKYKMQ